MVERAAGDEELKGEVLALLEHHADVDPRAMDRAQWRGFNLLGQAVTQVREALLWEHSLRKGG